MGKSKSIWRDIKGYEGHYRVSRDGRVLSCARSFEGVRLGTVCTIHWKARLLRAQSDHHGRTGGHARVLLNKHGDGGTKFYIFDLVKAAFGIAAARALPYPLGGNLSRRTRFTA